MNAQIWLVEIRVKDWIHVPDGQDRTIAYEEVLASSEFGARHAGYDQFAKRCKYEPVMRRKFEQLKLTLNDVCAPDAVELDS